MTPIRQRHLAAVRLLESLGLDYILLERKNGHYAYRAWTPPVVQSNGGETVKRGKLRISLR
jgi:hypothetical protein